MSTAYGTIPAGEGCRQPACLADAAPATVGRFNQRAASYDRHAAIQRDMAAWLARWLPPQDSDAAHQDIAALDLGAGSGTFTRYLAQRFATVSALDSSRAMLHKGRSSLPAVHWQEGDAWTLRPLRTADLGSIGYLASSSLLQWCRTPHATLRHWAQRCRSGTRMLHGFYVEGTLRQWQAVFGEHNPLDWLDAATWQDAFAAAGWRVLRSGHEERAYHFNNALALARSLHGTGAIANAGQLGSGRFRTLLRQYDARYHIADLPPDTPLYSFAEDPPASGSGAQQHTPFEGTCTTHTDANVAPPEAGGKGQTCATRPHPPASGVYATWSFFRIEAELA